MSRVDKYTGRSEANGGYFMNLLTRLALLDPVYAASVKVERHEHNV